MLTAVFNPPGGSSPDGSSAPHAKAVAMNARPIRTFTLAIGLMMPALSASSALAAQKHPQHRADRLSEQSRSSGYGSVPGPAQDPEAAAMRNAQKLWPGRPLCDDGGYRIGPCDSSGGGGGGGGGGM